MELILGGIEAGGTKCVCAIRAYDSQSDVNILLDGLKTLLPRAVTPSS